jgi:hypothetical protein
MFFGFYIQNIVKHEFGLKKKWYFLFTPSYWGCKRNKRNNNKNIIINDYKCEKEIKLNIIKDPTNEYVSKYFNNNKSNIINGNNKEMDKTGLSL